MPEVMLHRYATSAKEEPKAAPTNVEVTVPDDVLEAIKSANKLCADTTKYLVQVHSQLLSELAKHTQILQTLAEASAKVKGGANGEAWSFDVSRDSMNRIEKITAKRK